MPSAQPDTARPRRRHRRQPGRPLIHLVNPLWDAAGGSEWTTVELYRSLKADGRADVFLWSEHRPHAHFAGSLPVRRIRYPFRFPRGGTLVIVGVYFPIGAWLERARAARIVVRYNTPQEQALIDLLRRLNARVPRRIDLSYPSALLKETAGLPGTVDPVPLDLQRFRPRGGQDAVRTQGEFVVGRLSRDVGFKHHPEDPGLYRQIAAAGGRVRLMGGTCLRAELDAQPGVELLPACSEEPEQFLQGLDCFFYRTDEIWLEAFGRVVGEAMACGLPVVCHRSGGYSEWIRHGENGFLFDTTAEAAGILRRLQADPGLRAAVGARARATVESYCAPAARQELLDFYLAS